MGFTCCDSLCHWKTGKKSSDAEEEENQKGVISGFLCEKTFTFTDIVSLLMLRLTFIFSETQEAEEVKIAKVEKVEMLRWSYIYSLRSKTHFIVFYNIKHILDIIAKNISEVENFEWHIIPLLNPDGYQYSRTTDRLWRKNRVMHMSCLYWNL